MAHPGRPSFGIELEMIVRYRKSDYFEDYYRHLARCGTRGISPTDRFLEIMKEKVIRFLRKKGFGVNDAYTLEPSPKLWSVKEDASVYGEGLFGYEGYRNNPFVHDEAEVGIEITSPAFSYTNKSIRKISDFLRVLKRSFNCRVSSRCGFHVHIGSYTTNLYRSQGFSLETIHRLLEILARFERPINRIHPPHRIEGNDYCRPLSNKHAFITPNYTWPEPHEKWSPSNPQLIMDDIATLDTLLVLDTALGGKDTAYNFSNLLTVEEGSEQDPPINTIEFRQHQCTVDFCAIVHWVEVVVSLVKNAQLPPPSSNADNVYFFRPVRASAVPQSNEEHDTIAFLKALGCVKAAQYYRGKLYTYVYPEEEDSGDEDVGLENNSDDNTSDQTEDEEGGNEEDDDDDDEIAQAERDSDETLADTEDQDSNKSPSDIIGSGSEEADELEVESDDDSEDFGSELESIASDGSTDTKTISSAFRGDLSESDFIRIPGSSKS